MNKMMDTDIMEQNRRISAVKYFALGLCLALFVLYGIVIG